MRAIIFFLVFLGLLTSQVYHMPSGLPQFSHVVLLFFCVLVFFFIPKIGVSLISVKGGKVFLCLSLFILYVLVVNFSFSLMLGDIRFNSFTLHLIYNALLFFCFYEFLVAFRGASRLVMTAIFLALSLLVILYLLGFGRYGFAPRYNAYFNDPNQMAFWVLCMYSIFFIGVQGQVFLKLSLFLMASFAVFATISRSAMIGLSLTLLSFLLSAFSSGNNEKYQGVFKRAGLSLGLCSIAFAAYTLSVESDLSNFILSRFEEIDLWKQAEIRGFTRVLDYPMYLILGAGQGGDYRFDSVHEIHSTWIAFLFYYGIFGLFLFGMFVFFVGKGLSFVQFIAFLGPLAYSMSTFGARTPVFWVFMACALYFSTRGSDVIGEA